MHNNIGLPTPRGTGTSGFVMTNKAYVRPTKYSLPEFQQKSIKIERANPEIVLHEQKREIECKLLTIQMEMEEKGKSEKEINNFISLQRELELKKLLNRSRNHSYYSEKSRAEDDRKRFSSDLQVHTHSRSEAQTRKNELMARALRIGFNFDPEKAFDFEGKKKEKEEKKLRRIEEEKKRKKEMEREIERRRRREEERKWNSIKREIRKQEKEKKKVEKIKSRWGEDNEENDFHEERRRERNDIKIEEEYKKQKAKRNDRELENERSTRWGQPVIKRNRDKSLEKEDSTMKKRKKLFQEVNFSEKDPDSPDYSSSSSDEEDWSMKDVKLKKK